jgi:hypothetical protein
MQMRLWLFTLLGFTSVGLGVLVYVIPSDLGRFFGGCLLAVGAMNILFHRSFGRKVFGSGRSMRPPIISRFWGQVGQPGAQLLYLGIGIILSVAGGVLIVKSIL